MKRVTFLVPLVAVVAMVVAALAVDAGCSAEPRAQGKSQVTAESFNDRSMELPDELLRGAIDIHVHAGPHLKSSPRSVDPMQAARQAKAAGMRGLVYMDVLENSSGTAWLVSRMVPDIQVFGGIILNTAYGGMNPRSVKTALYYGDGAKYIQFGTHSAYFQASREGRVMDGKYRLIQDVYPKFKEEELSRAIRIPVNEDPGPELDEILKLVADHPHVYIDSGHVSVEEALRLVDLKKVYGYQKVIVSSSVTKLATVEQLKYMISQGAVIEHTIASYMAQQMIPGTHYYIEEDYMSIDEAMDKEAEGGIRRVGEMIRALGAENCILSTDSGRYSMPTPLECMRVFIACMLDLKISPEEIRLMVKTNPEKLLGIEN